MSKLLGQSPLKVIGVLVNTAPLLGVEMDADCVGGGEGIVACRPALLLVGPGLAAKTVEFKPPANTKTSVRGII